MPQLQAIREAWCALGESVPIIADGGIVYDKDIFLALMAGASSVMLGNLLSGTDEAPGRVIFDPATQEKRKVYRGMTSPQAVLEALYENGSGDAETTPAEGQEMQVRYKGGIAPILQRICGHLRSSISYAGESSLTDAREKIVSDVLSYFIRLSEASRAESFER